MLDSAFLFKIALQFIKGMAKKGNRVQVILECTEHKTSGKSGTSRYITTKNKKNNYFITKKRSEGFYKSN